ARPPEHLLPVKQIAERGDRADGRKRSLAVPAADACVEDRVRESEEKLDVGVNTVLTGTVLVSARNKLTEEIPMPRRQLRVRPIRTVFGDHLVLVGETGAQLEQSHSLRQVIV